LRDSEIYHKVYDSFKQAVDLVTGGPFISVRVLFLRSNGGICCDKRADRKKKTAL
jgi:hypothetical protein